MSEEGELLKWHVGVTWIWKGKQGSLLESGDGITGVESLFRIVRLGIGSKWTWASGYECFRQMINWSCVEIRMEMWSWKCDTIQFLRAGFFEGILDRMNVFKAEASSDQEREERILFEWTVWVFLKLSSPVKQIPFSESFGISLFTKHPAATLEVHCFDKHAVPILSLKLDQRRKVWLSVFVYVHSSWLVYSHSSWLCTAPQ